MANAVGPAPKSRSFQSTKMDWQLARRKQMLTLISAAAAAEANSQPVILNAITEEDGSTAMTEEDGATVITDE